MKALVTGGLGFLGSNISDELEAKNIYFRILDKNKNSKVPKSRLDKTIFADVTDKGAMRSLEREGFDLIFHFAAPCSNTQFIKDPLCLTETVNGMQNVMELARIVGAKVVYPTSGTVYSGQFPQNEEVVLPMPISLYAAGKIMYEYVADYYKRIYNISSTGLRIFAGYGDREEYKLDLASAITLFLTPMLNGESPVIWGDGTQTRDFVYVKDISNIAVKIALDSKSPRVINVGSGEAHSFNDIVKVINEKLGTEIKPKYVEKPKGYLENTKGDISLARELYGLIPTTLDAGIKKYIEYRKTHHDGY